MVSFSHASWEVFAVAISGTMDSVTEPTIACKINLSYLCRKVYAGFNVSVVPNVIIGYGQELLSAR